MEWKRYLYCKEVLFSFFLALALRCRIVLTGDQPCTCLRGETRLELPPYLYRSYTVFPN